MQGQREFHNLFGYQDSHEASVNGVVATKIYIHFTIHFPHLQTQPVSIRQVFIVLCFFSQVMCARAVLHLRALTVSFTGSS